MRDIRLAQTIAPFGVGAIYDYQGESLMLTDAGEWDKLATRRIVSPRLESALGGTELRTPPSVSSFASEKSPGIPFVRFPSWMFCQDCRRMRRQKRSDETGVSPACFVCGAGMVPMRFIAVCTKHSHVMDVPWDRWAHSEPLNEDQRKCALAGQELVFEPVANAGEALSGLRVACRGCRAQRTLAGLTSTDSLRRIGIKCLGGQPWQFNQPLCDERVEVLQRGATNVTTLEVSSALDIPEVERASDELDDVIDSHHLFAYVSSSPDSPLADSLIATIAQELNVTKEQVLGRLNGQGKDATPEKSQTITLLDAEWDAFKNVMDSPGNDLGHPNFEVSRQNLGSEWKDNGVGLLSLVESVLLVSRLREVRALQGFRRYSDDSDFVRANLGGGAGWDWAPAIEAFGEGVFIGLSNDALQQWESNEAVMARASRLETRRQRSQVGSRLPTVTPRSLLLHTTSHLLMRQLSFGSGYAAASLRERVYSNNGQAGILIYTASDDTEGTLGGLVREGEGSRLQATLMRALEAATWCSNDPVCAESPGQGMNSMNLASCHACALSSETSCSRMNLGLDRVLLIGAPDGSVPGFFGDVLQRLRDQIAAINV
ncbi:DUF1998 domain-containing protein [Arthrobacter sp. 162MFSha1.1]|uniref:DUF1998 domain-containing protein n=1 Tax=Arthrobacter sp. 162MFSha1.1 TaxID=1151119 RepID=UPI00039D63CC|nr:DUF1998 domain-containing protein [Arthrobacter sp. 162MFSha1.1]